MILSGREIERHLGHEISIEPFVKSRLNPNSYNLTLAAPYVAITNGVRHFCGYMNQENDFCFLDDFPEFSQERELLT